MRHWRVSSRSEQPATRNEYNMHRYVPVYKPYTWTGRVSQILWAAWVSIILFLLLHLSKLKEHLLKCGLGNRIVRDAQLGFCALDTIKQMPE